jgi:hypothetical protein
LPVTRVPAVYWTFAVSEIDAERRRLLAELPLAAVLVGSGLGVTAAAASTTSPARSETMNALETSLENSRTQKKGVTLVVGGSTVAMLVTEVADGFVVGRSQQYDRIAVRLDKVDAVLG